MAESLKAAAGKLLYGFLFVAVLPFGLVAWARATEDLIGLPGYEARGAGGAVVGIGLLMMMSAFFSLWRDGGGLPMNAFPPPRFVDRGVYGLLGHPIYVGFVLACGGVSLVTGSASGLWLVTPAVALAAFALVVGYEGPSLRARFGDRYRPPRLHLPLPDAETPTVWNRASVFVLVFLPWTVAYEAVQFMGVPPDGVVSHLPFEAHWPVLEWSTAVYASVYFLVLLTPLVASTGKALHRFSMSALVATVAVTVIYLTVPLIAPPRPFEATSFLGRLLAHEQGFNNTVAAFPAFHVLWAFFAAAAWPGRRRTAVFLWASCIALSCITTGMHSLADVGFALLLFPLFHRYDRVWSWMRRGSESVANAWREWRVGPVRVMNHGFFGGASMAVGVLIAGMAVGPDFLPGGAIVAPLGLLGAAAWAQKLEGSPALLRPFGFYGSVLGVSAGVVISQIVAGNGWVLFGGFAVAAPWVQAIGRFRCLIQGCCHGGPAPAHLGIRYFHNRSRVTRLADLAGVAIYPTPLISILGNLIIGAMLVRLWSLGAAPTFVAGTYFLLSGLARFVEESYRAEPQTKLVGPLHIYHWFAIASVVIGAALSGIDAVPPAGWIHAPTPGTVLLAVIMGIAAGFAMGVDLPGSNRRFSRLAEIDPPPRILTLQEIKGEAGE
jgi:protein-S-isoprenylcysteine O-methyltransferase Ste14